jgi:tetratricopeptide (TPR) repeat protein
MTGAWKTRPASPNPTSPTFTISGLFSRNHFVSNYRLQGIFMIVESRTYRLNSRYTLVIPAYLILLVSLCSPTCSQTPAQQSSDDPVIKELQSRLVAAAQAQQSGNPEAIDQANRRVVAFGLKQMGSVRAMEGVIPAAVELFKQSLAYEDLSTVHLQLALAYARGAAVDDALQQTSRVVEMDPKNAAGWNLQGRLFMVKKDYQKAIESLEKSLALQSDVETAYSMATAQLKLKQQDKAESVFKKIEELTGNKASMHIMVGRAYESNGYPAEAEKEYKAAIAIDPRVSRGHYFLGLFYLVKNSWEPSPEAREQFEAEVAINPQDFFGNYFLGYMASAEKKYAESDRYLKVAAAAKPDWPEPYLYMGLNAYGQGSDANAEPLLRKAIELTGTAEDRNNFQIRRAYFTLGRIFFRTGRREQGSKLIQKSREMETKLVVDARQQALSSKDLASENPEQEQSIVGDGNLAAVTNPAAPVDAEVFKKAGLSEREQQELTSAEQQLRSILGNAFNDLGTSEARRRKYDLALEHFLDAERWKPETEGLMRNIGLAAFLSGKYSESARAFKVVVGKDPADQRSQAMLAMSLYSIKDYGEAIKAFDKIQEVAMNDPRMAYGWAASLARTNNRQQASSVLEKFTAQPLPTDLLVRACQLYQEIGDRTASQSCFDKAKTQDPNVKAPNQP